MYLSPQLLFLYLWSRKYYAPFIDFTTFDFENQSYNAIH